MRANSFAAAFVAVVLAVAGCGGEGAGTGPNVPPAPPVSPTPPPEFDEVIIDFETPQVPNGKEMIDPYVDPATGVRFSAVDGSVGLVRNSEAKACIAGVSANDQVLGTGENTSTIGQGGFGIRVDFPESLPSGSEISFRAQTEFSGVVVFLELHDDIGLGYSTGATTRVASSNCQQQAGSSRRGWAEVSMPTKLLREMRYGIIKSQHGHSFVIDDVKIMRRK